MPKTAIRAMLITLDRANAAKNTLVTATTSKAMDWTMLAEIGIRESGFRNIDKIGGQGVGVFEIDLGQNPSVTAEQASNVTWAAGWAANRLAANFAVLAKAYPKLDADYLLQATAASYNFGTGNIVGTHIR